MPVIPYLLSSNALLIVKHTPIFITNVTPLIVPLQFFQRLKCFVWFFLSFCGECKVIVPFLGTMDHAVADAGKKVVNLENRKQTKEAVGLPG